MSSIGSQLGCSRAMPDCVRIQAKSEFCPHARESAKAEAKYRSGNFGLVKALLNRKHFTLKG